MSTNKNMKRANLFVIGISKCGSSWLHFYLDSHPDIFMSKQAELHFFGERYPNELEDFNSNFPFELEYKYYGESTPIYFKNPITAQQIKKYSPEAKIITIVRDPIERLLSFIYYAKQLGNIKEKRTLHEIFADLNQTVLNDSHYERHLPTFEKHFGKNYKIISLEKAKKNLPDFDNELCNFLNIENKFLTRHSGSKNKNATGSKMFRLIYKITIRPIKQRMPKLYKYLLKSKIMKVTKEFLLQLLGTAKKEPLPNELYQRLKKEFLPTYTYLHEKGFKDIYKITE
ncbi:MAG: sulfotransferase [bacterium]